MHYTLVLLFSAVAATAQTAPPPPALEIHGVVVEGGANTPLDGAEVAIDILRAGHLTKITTDVSGHFRVAIEEPGTYIVRAGKEGYTDDGKNQMRGALSNQREVQLDAGHPSADLRLLLVREGHLTGRVVDADTGKPIPNFRVYPMGIDYYRGEIYHWGGPPAAANSDGEFDIGGLRPGDYVANIGPQVIGKEQFLTKFAEADLKAVDKDYQELYWPGGGGLDVALPVPVPPGGSASVGAVQVHKAPYYRIHILLAGAGCTAGEKVQIFSDVNGGEGECGRDYLLRNFPPGSYALYFDAGKTEDDRKRVIQWVDVVDHNVELPVTLARGIDIDGRIVVADGAAKPAMDKLKIRMMVTGHIQFAGEQQPVPVDAEGRFRLVNRPVARGRISVMGLPGNFYVKEVRYNGAAVTDNIIPFDAGAQAQSLAIEVDDRPAYVTGTVVDCENPVSQAHVVLVNWPASREDIYLSEKTASSDDRGNFRFTALAPGEYRLFAIFADAVGKLDRPQTLDHLLGRAERITLSSGGSQNVPLRVIDLNR